MTNSTVEVSPLRDLLERLSNTIGVSGREKAIRALIKDELEGDVERMEVDALGNLIVFKPGDGPEPRLRVMVTAHMDEIGFMITRIEKSGLLRFRAVGGVDQRLLLGIRLLVGDDQLPGVIGAPPPHLQSREKRRKLIELEDLTIDLGASSEKQIEGKVKVGDYATFANRFTLLSDDPSWPTVRGKAFDDRAGCTALVSLLKGRYPVDVVGVFSVQEEVGLRGAHVAAYRVEPDAAIALEGTIADDIPQPEDEDVTPVTRLGDGPAITLMDRSMVTHPGLLRLLQDTAEAEGIGVQYKAPGIGSTDSGAIHLAREGVPATTVAVPCRYIHGPASVLNLNDLANTVRLVSATLGRIERAHLQRPQ